MKSITLSNPYWRASSTQVFAAMNGRAIKFGQVGGPRRNGDYGAAAALPSIRSGLQRPWFRGG
jgi:hypothetical protein